MRRFPQLLFSAVVAVLCLTFWPRAFAADETPPLAGLPSAPGPHIAKLEALGDNSWLELGPPAPDPEWGRARGRAWTGVMPFAPSLGGAFLYGEGVHGWFDRETGRYMDGLWFYDLMAHRWITVRPGTDVRNPPELIVNDEGFMAFPSGEPAPIAPRLTALMGSLKVILVGWYAVPEQTSPEQARDQFEGEAQAALDRTAQAFRDAGVTTAIVSNLTTRIQLKKIEALGLLTAIPLTDQVAAVACGIYLDSPVVDLDYAEDSVAAADANFVLTAGGMIVEIQGTAEKGPFSEAQFLALLRLAQKGAAELCMLQRQVLGL